MHWRDHLDSTLLGAYSLFDDATDGFKEVDCVVIRTSREDHNLGASGKKNIHVAHTNFSKKPMQLKVSISSVIAEIAGTNNPDKWVNVPITLFVKKEKVKGEIVDALRVKRQKVVQQKDYAPCNAKLRACTSLADLQVVFMALLPDEKTACNAAKEEMKVKLTPKTE